MLGFNAANAAGFDQEICDPALRQIRRSRFSRRIQKIVGHHVAVAISRIGFIGGQFHFVHLPIGLELLELLAVDQFDVGSEMLLHRNIFLEGIGFAGMNDTNKPGFAEFSRLADDVLPILKNVQADKGELDFRRKTVVHADESRRPPASTAPSVLFVEDNDAPSLAAGEMEGDRCSHNARAEDDEVGGLWRLLFRSCHSLLNLPFFKSRRTW